MRYREVWLSRTLSCREVWLTSAQLFKGSDVGCRRRIHSMLKGDRNAHGLNGEDDSWDIDIEGACGECAAAQATGRHWAGSVDTYGVGDDVDGFQVRTRSKHWYDLNIRPNDDQGKIFVLVTGKAPVFRVHGWLLARDARRDCWWKAYSNRPKAWFVPKEHLLPLNQLEEAFLPEWLR
jgi:hypothetical protein